MFSRRLEIIKIIPYGDTPLYVTTNSKPITWGNQTYTPTPGLKRSSFNQQDNGLSEAVTVSFPAGHPWAKRFRTEVDFPLTRVIILRSTDGGQSFKVRFSGKVNYDQGSGSRIELKCENGYQSAKREATGVVMVTACPYSIYDQDCRLNEATYEKTATITKRLSSSEYEVSGIETLADGYLQAGLLKNGAQWRTIREHVGKKLTLDIDLDGIPLNTEVKVYPGCRQSFERCRDVFSNTINNGGFRHIPSRSPVNGTSII